MAELVSVSTARPAYRFTAADTARDLAATLPPRAAARFARLVAASGNETRDIVVPLEQLRRLESVETRTAQYRAHAIRLGEAAAREALASAGVAPAAVGAVIGVSSTGYLMPTLETHLIERLGLAPTCRRVPLTQLGCAGGAAGLGLAAALSAAAPAEHVLLVSVELPSLSRPGAHRSASDIIAATQFGDGAAAALISGRAHGRGPAVLASGSSLFPNTLDRDGIDLTASGLRLQRPRGLAEILRQQLAGAVDRFLTTQRLTRPDIAFWVVHPRNPELLDAAGASLGLSESVLAASRRIWRRRGNIVSSAVFHVLRELSDSAPPPTGALGLVVAFGAGFSCELVLLRAGGWLAGGARDAAGEA